MPGIFIISAIFSVTTQKESLLDGHYHTPHYYIDFEASHARMVIASTWSLIF